MKTETLHSFDANEVALIAERPASPLNNTEPWVRAAFRFIKKAEASRSLPYFDLNDPVRARATIGYGFNIEGVDQNLFFVLWEMGIINSNTTQAQEERLLRQFYNAIIKVKNDYKGAAADFKRICDEQLRQKLNELAQTVTGNTATTFSITDIQSDDVFAGILLGTEKQINDVTIVVKGYQPALDRILQNSLAHESKEYVAILSMYYK
jgi:hypothetical protein